MLRHLVRKSFLVPALALAALMALPSVSHAQFKQGDWVMTLAGTGDNNNDFNRGGFAVEGSLGYFVTQNIELSVRQSIGYAEHPSDFTGVTQVGGDYVFNLGAWAPYVGGNAGLGYGSKQKGGAEVGAEAGVRYFVNASTFVFFQAEWDFFSAHTVDLADAKGDQEIIYSLGLGVKLN